MLFRNHYWFSPLVVCFLSQFQFVVANDIGYRNDDNVAVVTKISSRPVMQERKLDGVNLADLWTLNEPEWEYDGDPRSKRFRLKFTVNDMIDESMFTSTWWTKDCSAGGVLLAAEGLGYSFAYENNGDPPGDGTGTREFSTTFHAAPNVWDNSEIYTEDYDDILQARNAIVTVCVRTSLTTPGGDIEVNFIESILSLQYSFTDGFLTFDDINVKKPEG